MPSLVAYAAALCAAASAWVVRGALAFQSAAPDAPKLGLLPPVWELALFLVAGACTVFLLKPSTDRVLPLFATAICLLPWLPGVRSPAALMWTGPLAVAVWWGAVATTMALGAGFRERLAVFRIEACGQARYGPVLASIVASLFFALVAFGARQAVPSGDEPHYLIITQSLLTDGDLQIENNHARRDYEPYFHGSLQPDFWRLGRNGAIYSVHAPGLPALVAPAFLIGGYKGVVILLVLVSAIAAGLLWHLAFAVSGRASAAWFAVAATASATPVAFHAFTVFPDGPAGFLLLTGVWALLRLAQVSPRIPLGSTRVWMLHGLALALLPWMHARLAALAGAAAIVILLRMPRNREGVLRAMAFLAAPIVSAIAWFGFFYVIYGTPNPAAPWTQLVTSWRFIPGGLAGILFDQQFGALPYAPVLVVCAAGWIVLARRNLRLACELAVIAVPYMLVTTRLWIWWAGWSAPARFWVPLFWMGGIAAAIAWSVLRTRAARATAGALLVGSTATTVALAFAYGGRLAYNVRDGYSRWFEWMSPLTDLTRGLPSFFQLLERQWMFDLQVLVAVAIGVASFFILRWVDARVGRSGGFVLLMLAIFAAAVAALVGTVLRMNETAGLRSGAAQLRLLHAAAQPHRVGLLYTGGVPHVTGVATIVGGMTIESPPRLASEPGAPPLVLPGWFPAGTYQVSAVAAETTPWDVRILRAGPPILQGTTAAGGELRLSVRLPVNTPAFILRGGGLRSASLHATHVPTRQERALVDRATKARRYERMVVWFVDGNAFDDPGGVWIRGQGAESRLLLQPDSGTWARVLVRNGLVANEVSLIADEGDWNWSAPMAPGQETDLRVPVNPERGAVLLQVRSASGFRPSELDSSSRDTRLLGVWLGVR